MNDNEPALTIGDILGLPKPNTASAAVWRRWHELGVDADDFHHLDTADVRDRHLWLILSYMPCVQNSGIHEFLCRGGGENWSETLEAFQAIGANGESEALRQVFALFPGRSPCRDQTAREQQIGEIRHSLPAGPGGSLPYLDDVINCERESSDRIYELLLEYWQRLGADQK
jgi:hypothetical protein